MKESFRADLEGALENIIERPTQSSDRLNPLADFAKGQLKRFGLSGAVGGSEGELKVAGLARVKDWDVAYKFAGKFRLLLSLKSIWRNAPGTVPNRLDDHMGEIANIQQLHPEIVIGYVVLFDIVADRRRRSGGTWSDFFESSVQKIAIRKAPLWNQGLLEGFWFIRFDSRKPKGERIVDHERTQAEGERFIEDLFTELRRREPAIPFQLPA